MPKDLKINKKKILIIDDSEIVRTTLKKVLEFVGSYDIIEAEEGHCAEKLIENNCPDLIILDIHLPGKSGYELLWDLKKKPRSKQVKVVAISGYSGNIGSAIMGALGADCYFDKPVDNNTFLIKVAALLNG